MTVPTFFDFDKGLGDTLVSTSIVPYIVLSLQFSPVIIRDVTGSGSAPPTSGQLWPRRA